GSGSRRPAAFSKLDRQILDVLVADASTILFFFKQKTAYEMPKYWSSDVCSSDLKLDGYGWCAYASSFAWASAIPWIHTTGETPRSEERRVGKEGRTRWATYRGKKNKLLGPAMYRKHHTSH